MKRRTKAKRTARVSKAYEALFKPQNRASASYRRAHVRFNRALELVQRSKGFR